MTRDTEGHRMRVTARSMDGCPTTPPTADMIQGVASELGVSLSLERGLVETAEHAAALGFLGSPTVQVDGRDIEPAARTSLDVGVT